MPWRHMGKKVKMLLYAWLIPASNTGERSASWPGHFMPGLKAVSIHWVREEVDTKANLANFYKWRHLTPTENRIHGRPEDILIFVPTDTLSESGIGCFYILYPCTNPSRKVAGSIPDGVTGIFHWHNSSGRTMALGSIQPLQEISTRNISWE
jgi:hypothetical protein